MFICQKCRRQSSPGEKQFTRVMQTRDKVYLPRHKANRDESDDRGGRGVEIAREIKVCEGCTFPGV